MWFYMKNEQQIGPMRWEELTAAARDGRLLPMEAVWTDGMPQWQQAGTVNGLFATAPMSAEYAQGYAAQGYAAPPEPTDPILRMAIPIGRSWWAIAAGYFGLFSLILLPAPISLILGLIALSDIRKNPEKLGKGRAIFGIVMGTLGTALLLLLVIGAVAQRYLWPSSWPLSKQSCFWLLAQWRSDSQNFCF